MVQIKFSHEYYKMPLGISSNCRTDSDKKIRTWLIGVCTVLLEEMPRNFLNYDTAIVGTNEHYPLPKKGKFLMLVLFSVEDGETIGQTWQTLRSWSPDKEMFYQNEVGKEVEIVIA